MTPHYSLVAWEGFKASGTRKRPPRQRVRSSRQTGKVIETLKMVAQYDPVLAESRLVFTNAWLGIETDSPLAASAHLQALLSSVTMNINPCGGSTHLLTRDIARRLARELEVSPLVARLLVQRGLAEPAAAQAFLHPSLGQLHAPELMAGMREAVARLRRALEQHEKILIYGDYDVDGTMAVVVLLTALRMLGAEVEAYVPHRLTDGYGMRVPVVEEAAANGFRVVISVDTGIREHAVLARARELGVDCIVTDHHLPDGHLPPACAILNPRRPDCGYPEKSLAGVGVAFKLAQALLGERMTERLLQSFLKVVAIGTIADVVPLLGENRVIARFGLEGLRQPAQSGLAALIELAGLAGKEISAGDVGFRLAPRLNAAGRMENARDVIDLFTLPDAARTREIAERLERLNRERQRVEEEILRAIVAQLEQRADLREQYTLVLAGEGWHRGVIGIVAQRVVERYHRPALVIGIEDGVGVGSGRSIKRFHLLDALTSVGDLFQRFGGHAQAAGFALAVERIPELTRRFEEHARNVLTASDLEPVLRVDAPRGFGGGGLAALRGDHSA